MEQYRQVFDARVLSNGWDDATAALQLLLSHLEGDALNVALLVPMSRRTSRTGLADALSAHYGLDLIEIHMHTIRVFMTINIELNLKDGGQ